MKKFRVLLPIDGSEGSKLAIDTAKMAAEKFDMEIILFNSVDIRPKAVNNYSYDNVVVDAIKKTSELILKDARKELEGFHVEEVRAVGRAGEQIVDYCENNPVDIIIMATRGVGAVERFFMGSVTNYVLNHTPVPVLALPLWQKQ